MQSLFRISLVSTLLIIISFIPKTTFASSEISVKVKSSILQGVNKVESFYELTKDSCRITWETITEKRNEALNVQLMNRSECSLAFQEAEKLHEKVIQRILNDYTPSSIKSVMTGGLRNLQPDGSWNLIVAKAADKSADYQDYKKNYPNHKSKKSSNAILLDLIKQTQAHAPFKEMLKKHNLFLELESVEKVFNSKNQNGKTIIDDAGLFWWKPL